MNPQELIAKKEAVNTAYAAYAASAAFKACFESEEYKAFQAACVAYDKSRENLTQEQVLQLLKA